MIEERGLRMTVFVLPRGGGLQISDFVVESMIPGLTRICSLSKPQLAGMCKSNELQRQPIGGPCCSILLQNQTKHLARTDLD